MSRASSKKYPFHYQTFPPVITFKNVPTLHRSHPHFLPFFLQAKKGANYVCRRLRKSAESWTNSNLGQTFLIPEEIINPIEFFDAQYNFLQSGVFFPPPARIFFTLRHNKSLRRYRIKAEFKRRLYLQSGNQILLPSLLSRENLLSSQITRRRQLPESCCATIAASMERSTRWDNSLSCSSPA